jgi:clan AA aspartic protease
MIAGTVTDDLEATIGLTVRGPSGQVTRIRAVIGTGFDGYLTLPPTIVAELELVWQQIDRATLADGSEIDFNVFEGVVVWNRRSRVVFVDESDTEPLVGTALLAGHTLSAEFRPRGKVAIKSVRRRNG